MKATLKPIITTDSELFNITVQENDKEFDYPWHYHPELELTYILSSRGIRYVGNSIENFEDDDFVLLGSNLPHCWIKTEEQEVPSSAIVIYVYQKLLDNDLLSTQEFWHIKKLLALAKKGIKFNGKIARQ